MNYSDSAMSDSLFTLVHRVHNAVLHVVDEEWMADCLSDDGKIRRRRAGGEAAAARRRQRGREREACTPEWRVHASTHNPFPPLKRHE